MPDILQSNRTFTTRRARRQDAWVRIGLSGTTGSGKTVSALRLATGMQRVLDIPIHMIDTEKGRGEYDSDVFNYEYTELEAPFGPADYWAAIEYVASLGPRIIIVDNFSHVHEGQGGLLEMHADGVQRLMKAWKVSKPGKVTGFAWGPPKQAFKRLTQNIIRTNCHFIFLMRASNKLDWNKKDDKGQPLELGILPAIDKMFVYELLLHGILYPGADGVPVWSQGVSSTQDVMLKVPRPFRQMCAEPRQIDEAMGEEIGRWSRGPEPGGAPAQPQVPTINAKVKWDGQKLYGGKPITDVPAGERGFYAAALTAVLDKSNGKAKTRVQRWLDDIEPYLPVAPAGGGFAEPAQKEAIDPVTYVARSCGISAELAAEALDRYGQDLLVKIREGFELEANTLQLVPPTGYGDS